MHLNEKKVNLFTKSKYKLKLSLIDTEFQIESDRSKSQ